MKHLNDNRIYINIATATTVEHKLWVWCTISQPNQTCQDNAKKELNAHLSMKGTVELHQYLTRAKKLSTKLNTTRLLVVAGSAEDKENGIDQLLAFNNLAQEEKDMYSYTSNWYFIPFNPNGATTQDILLSMMKKQNYFLKYQ
eukprot:856428-Ditylum_brightwellii.AAC.1